MTAMLLTVLGIAGLLAEASPVPHPTGSACLDLIFGLTLWTQVVSLFYRHVNRTPVMQPSEVRALSRRLSRMVYLQLYVLVFVRQAVLMWSRMGHLAGAGPHHAPWEPFPSVAPFLVYGLAALVLINGLAATWNHGARKASRDAVVIRGGPPSLLHGQGGDAPLHIEHFERIGRPKFIGKQAQRGIAMLVIDAREVDDGLE
jgi:hypothetical protein